MSIRLIADVLDHVHDLPHVSKLVLICMADYADSNGECWPSFQTIANRSDITRRHVIRVVDGLEKAGYLTKVSVRPYKPTTYRICVRTSDVVMSLVTEETLVTARSLGSDSTVTSTSDTAMSPEPPIEPPKNRNYSEPRKKSTNPAHLLIEALSDRTGVKVTSWAKSTKIAQGLVEDGVTPEEIVAIVSWIEKQPYWEGKGVDLVIIRSQLDKFRTARKARARKPNPDYQGAG